MTNNTSTTATVELPKSLHKYIGQVKGNVMPGALPIDVNTPMHHVQRPFHPQAIHKYIRQHKCVNWDLFGVVTAVKHNGNLKIINGQHRVELVKALLPNFTTIPAHIIDVDSDTYVAQLFSAMNGGSSKNLSPEEMLWAEVIAEDADALRTKKWLEIADVSCGKVNDTAEYSVKRKIFEEALKHNTSATITAIDLIRDAYPNSKRIDGQVMNSLCYLFSLEAYADYGDNTKAKGKAFAKWFKNAADFHDIKVFHFDEYKNHNASSAWCVGGAYGFAQKFHRHNARKNTLHLVSPLHYIKDIYKGDNTRAYKKEDNNE